MTRMIHRLAMYCERKQLIPVPLRRFIQKRMGMLEIRRARWIARDPFANDPPESSYPGRYPYTLGIIKEFWHAHWPYIAACRDLGVPYKVVDISGPDWVAVVERAACDAYLVSPSLQLSIWKQMYDERVRIMIEEMGLTIFPNYTALWMDESKRRMSYWLRAHDVPHARTWVFYDLKEALGFAERTDLPIVYKSNMGSGASGVRIFRSRPALKDHIRRCFKKGFTTYRRCPNDKEWGSILLQEYLPNAREWRMVRIGESYFGHEKLKRGDFHSGSHEMSYGQPPADLLDFVRTVTDKGPFNNIDLDVFVTADGRYLVNELQALFGMDDPSEPHCIVDGKPGRMIWDDSSGSWQFEEGSFCDNYFDNLRIKTLLEELERGRTDEDSSYLDKEAQHVGSHGYVRNE